jgi:glycosyltransferase involved in cell wall biosynthesis
MDEMRAREPLHILVFEPRVEGHHLGYLKAITEDLLAAGHRLTLAVDTSAAAYEKIKTELAGLLSRVSVVSAYGDSNGKPSSGSIVPRIAALLARSQANLLFMPNLDEVGSAMLRRAAVGWMPPSELRGRLGGIWHRPRFLGPAGFSPNQHLKALGFTRLLRGNWFSQILVLDPYLHADFMRREPAAPVSFLPDFYPADFASDRAAARREIGLPDDRRVFLFYGGGYRRKGLDLAVRAMLAINKGEAAFLLCAGQQPEDCDIGQGLERLVGEGRAKVINRYIFNEEERQLFAASDAVLLPYRRHFGISGVLVRAIGAGLPVIASDEHLLGRLVRERGLGTLFPSGDVVALKAAIERMAQAPDNEMAQWRAAVRAASPVWSREAFRAALTGALDHATRATND